MITTETALWNKVRPWLTPHGPAVRIESYTSNGVSDSLWSTKAGIIFIELKIRKGNYINMQAWQVAFHERWLPQDSLYDWFLVSHRNKICLYTWGQLSNLTRVPTSKGVKLNIKENLPFFELEEKKDVDSWLRLIYEEG